MVRTTKQVLSLLLVVLMLLSVLPFGAFADESNPVYVNWDVAAVDPVSTTYFTHATTGVVNGHDYLYLAARGGKLFVYDVDEDKQITSANLTATDTPRDIIVDENGIVWMSGGAALLRYDPFTDKAEEIRATETGIKKLASFTGIVSDGKGKLYLGTMNQGYIICYDTVKKSYSYASDWLGLAPDYIDDSKFAGGGGLVYKDGYLYLTIDGDINGDGKNLHHLIKYDIAGRKIVDSIDISHGLYADDKHVRYVNLVDSILFLGNGGLTNAPLFVDISGSKMQFIDLPGLVSTAGAVTGELNGKVYFTGYTGDATTKAYMEYDVATKTSKALLKANDTFRMTGSNLVTVEGDDRLPGSSVLIPYNDENAGVINVKFWNPQTNEIVDRKANIGMTGGAGSNLNCLTVDPTGEYIYMGAYGNLGVSKYSVKEGKVVDTFQTYSHQTDALMFYGDYLYAGNYSAGTITQIDVENNYALKPLFSLRYSVFEQCRMFNLAGGENKVFCSTVPYSGMGGVLVWYDFDKNLTYVAAGPNPEDVYYADTAGLTLDTNVQKVKYTWYNAVSGEAMDFDDNDDGRDDRYLADGTPRFSGFLPEQVINNMFYMDGYIFGTTSIAGASGTFAAEDAQPLLFAYDVKAMKVVATCDVTNYIEGFDQQVRLLDQFAADPDVPYKFWGGIDDTLYTCTFDTKTNTFQSVKEEFSIQKDQVYSVPGDWRHRDILFAGEYLYVGFGRHVGTYMVRKNNPQEHYLVNEFSANTSVLGSDGNIYWISNETNKEPNNLNVFRVGEKAAPLIAKASVETAQNAINGLSDKITRKDGPAIEAARKAYDKLTDEQKAQITGVEKLIAAEEAYAKLPSTTLIIVLIVAGVLVLAGGSVAVVLILKKKKKNNPHAE